jgi:hypothetical protein
MSSSEISNSREVECCCPPFEPSKYQDGRKNYKLIQWNKKPFVVDGTRCLFHVPLAFGKAVMRALAKIEQAGAQVPKEDFMVLSDCSSPWWSDVLVSTSKETVEGAEVTMISGLYIAKAFEGDYSNMGKWLREIKELVKEVRRGVLEKEQVETEDEPLPHAEQVVIKRDFLPNATQVAEQQQHQQNEEEEEEFLPYAKRVTQQTEKHELEPIPNSIKVTKNIEEEPELLPNAKKVTNQKEEHEQELLFKPNPNQVRKREDETIFFYYPTCPKCAKKHGKNYVVIFAGISKV